MGFELREALRRLCVEIGWSYAVFWRAIGSPTPKHLVWEDGHWYGKSQLSGCDDASSQVNLPTEFRSQGEGSIDELVSKSMVPRVHVIGDGIVGQAASMGNHQWILRDVASDREPIFSHLPELKNQFLLGIQTIVIIPVLPHGVVQFGSTMRVMENNLFVNHVRTSFMKLVCEPGSYVALQEALCRSSLQHSFMSSASGYQFRDDCSNIDRSLSMRCNHQLSISPASRSLSQTSSCLSTRCHENLSKNDSERLLAEKIIRSSRPVARPCRPVIQPAGNSVLHVSNRYENGLAEARVMSHRDAMHVENEITFAADNLSFMEESFPPVGGGGTQEPPIVGIKASVEGMFGELDAYSLHPKLSTFGRANGQGSFNSAPAFTKENIQSPFCNVSGSNSQGMTMNTNTSNGDRGLINSSINKSQGMPSSGHPKQKHDSPLPYGFPSGSRHGHAQECMLGRSLGIGSAKPVDSSSFHLPNEKSSHFLPLANSGDDLFDVLGLYGSLDRDLADHSTHLSHPPIFYSADNDLSCTEILSGSNSDQLLDAVVSKINSGVKPCFDDDISYKTSTAKVSGPSIFCASSSNEGSASSGKRQPGGRASPSMPTSNAETAASTSVRSADSMDEAERSGCYKSQICLWVEEGGQDVKNDKLFGSRVERVDEMNKVNRKRPRPGETPRPRPKDRQLIMDRVKELREIVPNGAKCSIDALLEKTIKHMLFLQSVAKHADKLRDSGEPKIISKDGGVLLKDNFQGGATWAFEVGSQPLTCPIIVEDLNPPREMLVEMLCEERGVFLEIADLIRGLGLTILKGVMEARKNKVWARFAVEANRDVTRMEIFLSLVHSLEPTIDGGASPYSVHNNHMPDKMFNPCSIPVSAAISDHFQ